MASKIAAARGWLEKSIWDFSDVTTTDRGCLPHMTSCDMSSICTTQHVLTSCVMLCHADGWCHEGQTATACCNDITIVYMNTAACSHHTPAYMSVQMNRGGEGTVKGKNIVTFNTFEIPFNYIYIYTVLIRYMQPLCTPPDFLSGNQSALR